MSKFISAARSVAGIILVLTGGFFIFYTARLLYVTSGLRAIRVGGQGAYIGAIVFPIIGLLCAWGAWRCFRRARK
jgi:membrane protein implicated in regulation of membrane protease activity